MKSGSWSSYQAALPPEARAGGEDREDDPYSPYEEWERRMGIAADSARCERPDMPNGNSADCPCPPCEIANWWDGLGGLERGILFAGMVEQGFEWGEK